MSAGQPSADPSLDVDYDKRIEGKKWIPIESDSELLTQYIHTLGVSPDYTIEEVYGLDDDLLAMVNPNVVAVLMLFPYTDNYKRQRREQQQAQQSASNATTDGIYFLPQIVSNACGTIGVLHAVLNNRQTFEDSNNSSSWLTNFFNTTKSLPQGQRAKAFSEDTQIDEHHHTYARQGQTNAEESMNVDVHYNAFINHDNTIYELDGTKRQPVSHGPTTQHTFLKDVAKVIKETFMANDPTEARFSVLALVKSD